MSSTHLALLGGLAIGMAAGGALVPFTRHQLAGAVGRAQSTHPETPEMAESVPRVTRSQWACLVAISGLLTGLVLYRIGWSFNTAPPLLLLLGLIQLAYCDTTRRLLPKTLVYAIGAVELVVGLAIADGNLEWQRFWRAAFGAGVFFAVLFIMNLINARWMAFGDVRLAPVVGFGLAWISPTALIEGFFIANALAATIGIGLMVAKRANRKTQLPFGFYMAIGAAITILAWS